MKLRIIAATCAAALALTAAPAIGQHLEGDARSIYERWERMSAPPGTFWLDSSSDREVVRYTTARDVTLCLDEPSTVAGSIQGYALQVTWDRVNTLKLHPGNCLFFDARQVTVKPAAALPAGVVLRGRVETSRALVD
jgi:hypothetical protein